MNYRECARLLKERDEILLVTHSNPDGDTMCSAAALCSALRRAGKTAYLFPNRAAAKLLLSYTEAYFAPEGFVPAFVAAVDVATEKMFALGCEASADLCIDHHPTNSHYAASELIRPEKSSCGEIVLELIKSICGDLSREEANLLYIAVTTDTGCFQYANTNHQTLAAASELLRLGAEHHQICLRFFRRVSPARIRLEGLIYSGISLHRDGKVAVSMITREMLEASGATKDDFDDLAGLAGRVDGTVMNVTIRELPNGDSKVSVRSDPGISSSDICAVFGGGGHQMAAGCTIQAPPERAKELLLSVIDELWR